MQIDRNDTAVVFTDPQNEVLSETGLAWPLVHESLAEREVLLAAAPYIVRPLRFVLPVHSGLRPPWLLRRRARQQ